MGVAEVFNIDKFDKAKVVWSFSSSAHPRDWFRIELQIWTPSRRAAGEEDGGTWVAVMAVRDTHAHDRSMTVQERGRRGALVIVRAAPALLQSLSAVARLMRAWRW